MILDLEAWKTGASRVVLDAVANTASRSGMFTVVGHEVAPATIAACREAAYRFFEQDLGLKLGAASRPSAPGGFALRGERAYAHTVIESGPAHAKEIFDVGPPSWTSAALDPVPGFLAAVRHYYREMERVEEGVAAILSAALAHATGKDLPASFLSRGRGRHRGLLRLNWYPRRSGPARIADGAHVDWTPFTLIYPDQPGLELWQDDGWTDVPTDPGAFTVLIGEQLHMWSDGLFQNAKHRVQLDLGAEERLSLVYFGAEAIDVDDDTRIEPVCRAGVAPKFAPVEIRSYLKTRNAALWPSV